MKLQTATFAFILLAMKLSAQSSVGLSGIGGFNSFSSMENNFISNSLIKDWQISAVYGGEFSDNLNSNLYLISLGKRIGKHSFSARYTPGYRKDFIFSTGEAIILSDSNTQSLTSNFSYKELFGISYLNRFTENISAGFSLRFFSQDFSTESVSPVFSSDTIYLSQTLTTEHQNIWKGDLSIGYSPADNFKISLASKNLITLGESSLGEEFEPYKLKLEKGIIAGLSFLPSENIEINFIFETKKYLQFGYSQSFNMLNGKIGFSTSLFYNGFSSSILSGISPSIYFSNDIFGISISGIKYFDGRNKLFPLSDFNQTGIDNIINNKYSYDRAAVTFSFKLNTIQEQRIKFIDTEIVRDIFPTIEEHYSFEPFAKGKITNISSSKIEVTPSSIIKEINEEVFSRAIVLMPGDTAEVGFYTRIPNKINFERPSISSAEFLLYVDGDEAEDKIQKPVLINGSNAWDGKVFNLQYFIKRDIQSSMDYAKSILRSKKNELDTIKNILTNFFTAKYIFSSLADELVYTADPRASAEFVQFPSQTLKLKGGDCDDLAVLYSSLLESVGIETALVDYKNYEGLRHVNVLVNTELSSSQADLITKNDTKYFIRKNILGEDKVWIPVEVTAITNFDSAWQIGAEKFNREALNELGIAKGSVEIIEVN